MMRSTPADYAHFIVACLTHDIGYVRGIFKGDGDDGTRRRTSTKKGRSCAPHYLRKTNALYYA